MIRLDEMLTCTICAKVINKNEIVTLKLYVVETLCYLEVCFILSIFDIMEHILTNLVGKLELYGLIGNIWMYHCERY